MKKMIFLCLVLSGCCFCRQPPNYAYQPPITTYVQVPAWTAAPEPTPRVVRRTMKRTVQIVPRSQLEGVMR